MKHLLAVIQLSNITALKFTNTAVMSKRNAVFYAAARIALGRARARAHTHVLQLY